MTNYFNANLKMIFVPSSSNRKTGNLMQSYSSKSTCPASCPFKANGCYAAGGPAAIQWRRADNTNDKRFVANGKQLTAALIAAVADHARAEKTILYRHNVAGDMAKVDSDCLDHEMVMTIASSCQEASKFAKQLKAHFLPFTYTHCKLTSSNIETIKAANMLDFVINASCETVREVATAQAAGIPAVIASVNPLETIKQLDKLGINACQCPNQTTGTKCQLCKKCCCKNRQQVVIFAVHGSACKKAAAAINAKNNKQE